MGVSKVLILLASTLLYGALAVVIFFEVGDLLAFFMGLAVAVVALAVDSVASQVRGAP